MFSQVDNQTIDCGFNSDLRPFNSGLLQSVIQVRIKEEAVYLSLTTNVFKKSMTGSVLLLTIGLIVELTMHFSFSLATSLGEGRTRNLN